MLAVTLLITINFMWLTWLTHLQRQAREYIAIIDLIAFIEPTVKSNLQVPGVDAKTGDIYFSETKQKIKRNDQTRGLLYSYIENEEGKMQLSITATGLVSMRDYYGAHKVEKMFELVPTTQACARGIRIGDYPSKNSDDLYAQSQKSQPNGRLLYFSYEKQCPKLADILDTVQTIEPY